MKTKTMLACLASLLFILSGCMPGKVIRGDGDLVTHAIDISDYTHIQTGGASMKINYIQSDEAPYFEITTDKNIYEMFEFITEDEKTLKVRPKKEYRSGKNIFRQYNFRPTEFTVNTNSSKLKDVDVAGHIEFNVNSPLIAEDLDFSLAGSGYIKLNERTTANKVEIEIAGSATMEAVDLHCNSVDSNIAGSGTIKLSGSAEKASFEIAGSGDVRSFDFVVDNLHCSIAGSGDIEAFANNKINFDVAGSGKLKYKGNATDINRSIAGSGSVTKVD